jgi:cysteine desulfurase
MGCIYLDNNSTTPTLPAVWEAMRPFLSEVYGNPASAHQTGRRARQALEDARDRTAALLGADSDEVLFTSGATEANNLAVFSHAAPAPGHVIASPVEHPSVTEPIRQLLGRGIDVDWLPVNTEGTVQVHALAPLVRPEPRLVATMLANHETGTIQPVRALVDHVAGQIPFHCDAVQAVGKIPVHFHDLGVSTLSLSAHKFHGPKGVGALMVRRSVKLHPQLWGGHQQKARRPGTEPVALAVGLATALDLACSDMEIRREHVRRLRHRFLSRLGANLGHIDLNGPSEGGIPHTVNLSFLDVRADTLLMALDLAGIACSTGSACSSGSLLPSPVLRAMGVAEPALGSAMRFSLSAFQTEEEIDDAACRIVETARRLRQCNLNEVPL